MRSVVFVRSEVCVWFVGFEHVFLSWRWNLIECWQSASWARLILISSLDQLRHTADLEIDNHTRLVQLRVMLRVWARHTAIELMVLTRARIACSIDLLVVIQLLTLLTCWAIIGIIILILLKRLSVTISFCDLKAVNKNVQLVTCNFLVVAVRMTWCRRTSRFIQLVPVAFGQSHAVFTRIWISYLNWQLVQVTCRGSLHAVGRGPLRWLEELLMLLQSFALGWVL